MNKSSLRLVLALALLSAAACQPQDGGSPGSGGSGATGGRGGSRGGSGGTGGSQAGGTGGATGGTGGNAGTTGGTGGTGGATGGTGGNAGASGGAGGGSPDMGGGEAGGSTGCSDGNLLCKPLSAFPQAIKDTGLFQAPPDFTKRAARLLLFDPAMPLYSDGLRKERYILLPEGQKIDNTDRLKWNFPVGTIFVKTFFDDAMGGGNHPVETRFIRRINDFEYQYAVYQWNAAGTEAMLAANQADKRVPVPVRLAPRGMFTHNIPSEQDCEACHNENAKLTTAAFIGFDERRLNSKLRPTDAKTQLQTFADQGLFMAPPPAQPMVVDDMNPRLQQLKRFVFGNCAHCHNGQRIEDFRPEVMVENIVNKPPDASGIMVPRGYMRVVPGNPNMSVFFLQTRGTNLPDGFKAMPPVGVQFPPADEIENMRQWILSLPPR